LVATNLLRALAFLILVFFDENLVVLYLLTIVVATLTTFFAPAEAAMIPIVVTKRQLITANGMFIFALQASFVAGFAILGPLFSSLLGTQLLILVVAALYALAAAMCWVLPTSDPRAAPNRAGEAIGEARGAVAATFSQLREGLAYIGQNRSIFWSLSYLAITASLVGVMGVLGPDFAVKVLGLSEDGFVIVILPLGVGLVLGILALNVYGKYFSRQRIIEVGLISLGVSLVVLALAQRIGGPLLTGPIVSLLTVVVVVAFTAGVSYALVAVPAQTQLQEELPSEVRGRVFGVLNMLVSLASLGPIVVVGPLADSLGTPAVLAGSAGLVIVAGVVSVIKAPSSADVAHHHQTLGEPADPMTVTTTAPLTRTVRLHYLDAGEKASTKVASSVTPPEEEARPEGSSGPTG
ncbi:MAG: MFS transporter, partial [Candidatus Limnocylindrales bacterium]